MSIIEQEMDITEPYALRQRKEVPQIDRLHVSLELSSLSTPAYFSIFPSSRNAILFPDMYSRIISKKSPFILHDYLQRKSHRPYGPPTSVT